MTFLGTTNDGGLYVWTLWFMGACLFFFLFLLKHFGTFWDIFSITGLVMFVANFLYRSVAHLILCCSKLHWFCECIHGKPTTLSSGKRTVDVLCPES